MAQQGSKKLKSAAKKGRSNSTTLTKKGNPIQKSNKGGVYASNKALQKKLWANATLQTERLLAVKAKGCGKLTILKKLAEAPKEKKGDNKKNSKK